MVEWNNVERRSREMKNWGWLKREGRRWAVGEQKGTIWLSALLFYWFSLLFSIWTLPSTSNRRQMKRELLKSVCVCVCVSKVGEMLGGLEMGCREPSHKFTLCNSRDLQKITCKKTFVFIIKELVQKSWIHYLILV